jgi:hypothetical protein
LRAQENGLDGLMNLERRGQNLSAVAAEQEQKQASKACFAPQWKI